jgi:hypothetical protein
MTQALFTRPFNVSQDAKRFRDAASVGKQNQHRVALNVTTHNEHTPSTSSLQAVDGTWGQSFLHRLAPFLFKRHDDFVDYSGAM